MKEKILLNERYGAVEIDRSGTIINHNNTAKNILTTLHHANESEKITGRPLADFITAEYSADDSYLIEHLVSSIDGIMSVDVINYRNDESAIVRFIPVNDYYSSFFTLLKDSSSLYFELDISMNIILASESFCKRYRIDRSSVYGCRITDLIDEKNSEKIRASFVELSSETLHGVRIDGVKMLLQGEQVMSDINLIPVFNNIRKVNGCILHLDEVRLEKRAISDESKVRWMTALANFAGGIAHDYNNALTAIIGNITLARMEVKRGSETEELLRDAERAGTIIKKLTERLGVFTRSVKPAKEKCSIEQLIKNITASISESYSGEYLINIPDTLPQIDADREMFSLMLEEIIKNAVEFTAASDRKIEIKAQITEIETGKSFKEIYLVPGRYILLSIMDNGCGVCAELQGDIFDPYITTRENRDGIGLALAYTIVKRHRGFITYNPAEVKGTVFKIYIPLF